MNTIHLFIYFILFFFLQTSAFSQTAALGEERKEIKESLYNPLEFIHLDENTLLISDPDFEFPVYAVDIKSDKITHKIQRGRGPGELSSMDKSISIITDKIFIWDYGHQILYTYDKDLNYISSKRFPAYIRTLLTNGDYVFRIDDSADFIKIYRYDENNFQGDLIKSISKDEHQEFKQFNNFGIWQGFEVTLSSNHSLTLVNRFTSLVFSVNKDGLVFKTTQPADIVQNTHPGDSNATDIAYNALCSLSVSSDPEGRIYTLFKGEKADLSTLRKRYGNRINDFLMDFEASTDLFIYSDGKYQRKIQLPIAVNKIEIWKDRIFVLYSNKGTPEIRSFKL